MGDNPKAFPLFVGGGSFLEDSAGFQPKYSESDEAENQSPAKKVAPLVPFSSFFNERVSERPSSLEDSHPFLLFGEGHAVVGKPGAIASDNLVYDFSVEGNLRANAFADKPCNTSDECVEYASVVRVVADNCRLSPILARFWLFGECDKGEYRRQCHLLGFLQT